MIINLSADELPDSRAFSPSTPKQKPRKLPMLTPGPPPSHQITPSRNSKSLTLHPSKNSIYLKPPHPTSHHTQLPYRENLKKKQQKMDHLLSQLSTKKTNPKFNGNLERKLTTQDPQYIEDLIQTKGSIKKFLTNVLYTKKSRSFKSDPRYGKPNF